MPNFSGVWNLKEQIQAIAAGRWTGVPTFELYAWGEAGSGQLGDNTTIDKSSPIQVGSTTNWSYTATGNGHTVATKLDGTLWAWGLGTSGQVGDNTVIRRSSPVQIGSLTNWSKVACGFAHTVSNKTDGTLWAWGLNSQGRLGDDTVVNKSSPVQIGALTNWSQVSAGGNHTAAVKTGGTLWSWGNNDPNGQLGDGTIVRRSSPVQVGALTDWSQVSAGGQHTAAVKTNNTLWAWGNNDYGQIGDNSAGYLARKSSPVQIGALTTWSQVSAGSYQTMAIKTDGTLWAWGVNVFSGRLGDGTTINKSSPVQIGALTNWAQVATFDVHTSAVKTDGTLWTWGTNSSGRLGLNDTNERSSPVQVGSLTTWARISYGPRAPHNVALLQGQSN